MSVVRTGLPCRHILQSCSYLDMLLFDVKLVNKRWTTVSQVRFPLPSWNKNSEVSIISKISSELEKATLTQVQKYRKLLKIIDPLASVGSEHGIKI